MLANRINMYYDKSIILVIHVRTWRLYIIGGKPLMKDEVFTLDDFDIKKIAL